MHDLFVKDLIEKCNCKLIKGDLNTVIENFSKDTRTIETGDVYIGIKGENFDGNLLYQEALKKGASGCILSNDINIEDDILNKEDNVFIVTCDNTINALQLLASYKRSLYDIPIVGITGSVGKTSTKDIIASVLSQKYNVLKTQGNLNNEIGLPLTILSLKDHNMAVIEMGMNNLNEISVLSRIARPTVSVITNVGTAHIGNLGSRENILKAKLEILEGMNNDDVLIINNDNDMLHNYFLNHPIKQKVITYGINNKSDYMASNIKSLPDSSSYDVLLDNKNESFTINIPGEYFVLNGLCALTIGKLFNIPVKDIKKGIANFSLTERRMQVLKVKDFTVINDAYNANLDSMNSAIKYLKDIKERKIAVLGDMLELGDYSEQLHRDIAKTIINSEVDITVLVGPEMKFLDDELKKEGYQNVYHFDNNEDAVIKLNEIIKPDDYILLKASNGMHFNEIFDGLKK